MKRHLPKGLSYIEVIVSFTLFLLVSIIVFNLLAFTDSYWSFGDSRMEANISALISIEKIQQDMQGVSFKSVTCVTNPFSAVSFASPQNMSGDMVTDESGKLVIQRRVIYYHHKESGSIRKVEFPSSNGDALTSEEVIKCCWNQGETAARNIGSLSFVLNEMEKKLLIKVESEVFNRRKKNSTTLQGVVNLF